MYVIITFLSTKLTRLKYFPGAKAYLYINLVTNMIQKFAATPNAIIPIMLIVHKTLLV